AVQKCITAQGPTHFRPRWQSSHGFRERCGFSGSTTINSISGRTPRFFPRRTFVVLQLFPDRWVEPKTLVQLPRLLENLLPGTRGVENIPADEVAQDSRPLFLSPLAAK